MNVVITLAKYDQACFTEELNIIIWGFHSGGYEEYNLLGYDAV
jgi:hypothetical protein